MDYKYVAGAEALLLNNQRRRTSTLKLSLAAGAALLAGIGFTAKKAPDLTLASAQPARAEIITAAGPATPTLASIGYPLVKPTTTAATPPVPLMQLAAAATVPAILIQAAPSPEWQTVTVRPGDSFVKIVKRVGAKQPGKLPKQLVQLKATNKVKILVNSDKSVEKIEYAMNDLETFKIGVKAVITNLKSCAKKQRPNWPKPAVLPIRA